VPGNARHWTPPWPRRAEARADRSLSLAVRVPGSRNCSTTWLAQPAMPRSFASRGWCLSQPSAWPGCTAGQQTAEGRELGRALGWTASQLASFSATRVLAFRGDRKSLRRAIADGRAIAAARGIGDMIRVAHASEIILHLGYGEYPEAYEAATAMRQQDATGLTAEALPAIVEAGLRSGHAAEAAAALTELERYATASGTGWALGLLAPFRRSARPSGGSRRALPAGHRPPEPYDGHRGPGTRPPALRGMAAPPPAPGRRQAPPGKGAEPVHRDGRHPVRRANPDRASGRGLDHGGTAA